MTDDYRMGCKMIKKMTCRIKCKVTKKPAMMQKTKKLKYFIGF